MRKLGARSIVVLMGGVWLGCGGAEFIPTQDAGSPSTSASGAGGAGTTSASASGTSTGTTGTTDATSTGSTGPTTTGVGSSTSATGAGGEATATVTAGPATGSGGASGVGGGGGAGMGGKGTGGRAGSGGVGGTSGKAGSGGVGGLPVDAGRDSGSGGSTINDASHNDALSTCSGPVTFHMKAGSGKSTDYCVGSNCSNVWVTVTTSAGAPVTFTQGCSYSCSDCQPVACPPLACALPQPMKADGETFNWDGTSWDPGTCGANMSCRARLCAVPGKYIAKMCATRATMDGGPFTACNSQAMPICVDVPFEYPSTSVVEGAIN